MITLHLGINEGNVEAIVFKTIEGLAKYIKNLNNLDCVWLFSSGGEHAEIIVTENLMTIVKILCDPIFFNNKNYREVHLHKYFSFESAYSVALEMHDGHPKCYDKAGSNVNSQIHTF